MTKIRVYELAKEVDLPTKELMQVLQDEFDLEIKSHMSIIEGDELSIIREYFESLKDDEKEQEKPVDKSAKTKEKAKSLDVEELEDVYAPIKEKKNKNKNKNKKQVKDNRPQQKEKAVDPVVEIDEEITVGDFAKLLDVPNTKVITELMKMGTMASVNQTISSELATDLGILLGFEVKVKEPEVDENDIASLDFEDKEEDLVTRAPVVTVMGHVDHGKTSLLDAIRNTRVTKSEAGGITQHIGASSVYINDQRIVFLDTPGHEAFTQMRMRGAQATDIAILVVAADDGVMPQTIEAINHAKAAGVPIIIAINKMDKYEANPDRVKTELMEYGLTPEEWGGDTIMVPVSALKNEGIDELLELVIMVAEMEELKANPNRNAVGVVIEAQLDVGRGPVATVLVKKGTLKQGDFIVSGSASGKIRAMFDSNSKQIKNAKPSTPVLVLGLSEVPNAGDMIYAVSDDKTAKKFAEKQRIADKAEYVKRTSTVNLDDLYSKIGSGEMQDLNIIVKTDVKGTIEAVSNSLSKLSNEEVKVNVIHGAVGGITESDIMLASASNAIIIGFNVRPNQGAQEQAKDQGIDMRTYNVIYEAIEDVEKAIKGMLAPKFEEEVIGLAEIREIFKVPGVGNVAGIYVTSGKMARNAKVRLVRNNIVVHTGEISSLRRFKDDAKELATGYEGGLGIERYNDIKVGDIIEAFVINEIAQG
ncbi:MAG: translation initiation factor IF-2 [Tissierellia bacterium]|nr:translation initiation factor IF-2 [Tissierellia bacterium]